MGTTIEAVAVASGRWPTRRSARKLADDAIRASVARAGVSAGDIDLLLNAGLYRDRILAEPALAALIQADVGANPEDFHLGRHGTFSFDVANGACGLLTALHIADGLLRARVGFERGRNRLRISQDPAFGEQAVAWVGKAAASLLADHGVAPS